MNVKFNYTSIFVLFLFNCLTLMSQDAFAEEEPAEEAKDKPTEDKEKKKKVRKSFEERKLAPYFRVVAFQDRETKHNCDPIDARYGRCIELVDFVDYQPAWVLADKWENERKKPKSVRDFPDNLLAKLMYFYPKFNQTWTSSSEQNKTTIRRDTFARMRAYGELYAQLWEDVTYRWRNTDDPGIAALQAGGFKTVPTPRLSWDVENPYKRKSFSLPEQKYWLNGYNWVQPTLPVLPISDPLIDLLEKEPHFFPIAKYAIPEGHFVEPTPTVVMKGRFAIRLGFKNRLHDYQLMDGDRNTSGPFFEQMYPYQTIYNVDDVNYIPLNDFRYPKIQMGQDPSKIKNVLPVDSLADTSQQARLQFNRFYRLIATQVMQFSMQDYTANHMRILGSLTLMRTPPGSLANATGIARNLNASAQGQTDSNSKQSDQINRSVYSIPGGFRLEYHKIPEALIVEWLERLAVAYPVTPTFLYDFTEQLESDMKPLLKNQKPTILEGITDKSLKKWVVANAGDGVELNILLTEIRKRALHEKMATIKTSERDVEDTWLLLDHLNYAIAKSMDDTHGSLIAPAALSDLTAGTWEAVLGDHNYTTSKIEQGLGAIDPTAVCTTKDRLDALAEPSVGAVYVDQLFMGDDYEESKISNEELLWAARDKLSFLLFDNPDANKPKVERLVKLPNQKALYRARWNVWTGWHLLWGTEKFAGKERLTLRTAAICSDMVLTHPSLAASVVRAGLLEGEFFHTVPMRRSDTKNRSDYPGAPEVKRRKRKIKEAREMQPKKQTSRGDVLRKVGQGALKAKRGKDNIETTKGRLQEPSLSDAEIDKAANADLGNRGLKLSTDKKRVFKKRPNKVKTKDSVAYIREFVRAPLETVSGKSKGLVVVVFDSTKPQKWSPLRDVIAKTPYARTQTHSSLNRIIKTAHWALFFDASPDSNQVVQVYPSYVPSDDYAAKAVRPTWARNKTLDTSFVIDTGVFPLRRSYYECEGDVNEKALSSVAKCSGEDLSADTEGFSFGFSSFMTRWFRDDPRLAWEGGLEVHLDILHSGASLWNTPYPEISAVADRINGENEPSQVNSSPSYAWSFRPQTGLIFGLRHALDPSPLHRSFFKGTTWGADGAAGGSKVPRHEIGLRGAFLVGPGYNGLEGTAVADLWWARTLQQSRSDWANFAAYHPNWSGGFFTRYQYGFILKEDDDYERLYKLKGSHTILFGWRTNVRLPEPRPE